MSISINWFISQLLILLFIPGMPHDAIPLSDAEHNVAFEDLRIDDIDFSFSLDGNTMHLVGDFYLEKDLECLKHSSFDFKHKKAFTRGSATLELHREGKNWYEVNFYVDKFFMAKAKAIYHYSLDDQNDQINFYLKSNEINISSLDLIKSSKGFLKFSESARGTHVEYELIYELRPSFLRKSLYEIQKKETTRFLRDYKKYIGEHCSY